jgi:ribonuclease-3
VAAARASGERAEGDLEGLARRLSHRFERPRLLREALTHPSAADGPTQSYERLEFLGDRVLALIVSDLLLERFPGEAEGALARRLSALVRRETLAKVAVAFALGDYLILAKSEQEAGANANPGLLANACEAVIGALYVDGGLAAARDFVLPLWTPLLEADQTPPQDAKTALQEWAQGQGLALPDYREVHREGPPHEPVFTVEVSVIGQPAARGEGRSKRLAEQAAAARLLAKLGEARA